MSKTYKIFVIFHNELDANYYDQSTIENFIFVNVNPNNPHLHKYQNYQIINLYEFENFIPLGKSYAESEVIYNIYKNPTFFQNLDFIGFIHYDMVATNINKVNLEPLLKHFNHISFAPYSFDDEKKTKYLMDPSKPDRWIGRGKSCYSAVIEDLNAYYKQSYSQEDLKDQSINLCCSFLIKVENFKNLMSYISSIIESGKLDIYDKDKKFRMQGGLMERYFATWLALIDKNSISLPLQHNFTSTTEIINKYSLIRKIINKINSI